MYKVYGMSLSGNCYKVRLALEQLCAIYRWIEVDVLAGDTRRPEFLALNPQGKVPLLEIDTDRLLAESNAILCYVADGTPLFPDDRWLRAQVLQWMFFEQYSHEPYVAVARFICRFLPENHPRRAELPRLHERGHEALAIMERHLSSRRFLVAESYTLADIALFAYTQVAEEGGFAMAAYPAIQAWLERVRAQPAFVPMEWVGDRGGDSSQAAMDISLY
ncbi:glutathione S-transferase family protein [Chitinimonas lacunae]|uniref:Glutathione S-transferase family protein n=1 Tax=Chitinimonas lacunae TaxID=1963018 RepID=A0ABV8MQH6_9NEIS